MSTKHNISRAAQLGLLPSNAPVFLGGGIPTTINDETENISITTQNSTNINLDQPIANPSKTIGPSVVAQTNQTRHKAQVDAFIDRLTLGQMQPAIVPPGPKTHSVTITLPCTVFKSLEELSGTRQTPTLLRDTMLRLVTETAFQFKISFKATLAQARTTFVAIRRKARIFGNEGIRFVTIHMTTEESLHLSNLAKEFKLAPNQLMEVIAYELVQSNLVDNK
jgi:hypothetical protein